MVYPIVADYMFSNEHMNYLITYSFDIRNEELLSYYISFLRFVLALLVVLIIIDDFPYPYCLFATIVLPEIPLLDMVFQLHVLVVKSNKWKAEQEYDFSACEDSKCKFSALFNLLICTIIFV